MRNRVLAAVLCLSLGACTSAREQAFHDGVDQLVNKSGLASEYQRYIDNDPALQPATKKIRKETAERLKALIEEERKALEGR